MSFARVFAFLGCALSAGCGGSEAEMVADPHPTPNAWATVQLTLAGPAANGDKRKACLEEAHQWGLNIGASPVAATLNLADDGNRVDLPIGPRPLGKWSARAVCRVALAYAVGLDRMVRVARQEPQGCQEVGPVQGDDQGYAFFAVQIGSYEAALAAIQFNARMRGANYVTMDLARQVGLNFSINGRAFRCEAPPPPPPNEMQQPLVPAPVAPPPGAPPGAY